MTDELLPPSEYQMEIFDFLLLHSWSQAMENYGIHSKRVIKTIILRSAYGLHWYPGHPGGPWPYLNHDKESRLLYMIEKAAEEQQCLSIQEVISLAFALKQQILIDARYTHTQYPLHYVSGYIFKKLYICKITLSQG